MRVLFSCVAALRPFPAAPAARACICRSGPRGRLCHVGLVRSPGRGRRLSTAPGGDGRARADRPADAVSRVPRLGPARESGGRSCSRGGSRHSRRPRRSTPSTPVTSAWKPDLLVFGSADLAAPIVAASLGLPLVHQGFGQNGSPGDPRARRPRDSVAVARPRARPRIRSVACFAGRISISALRASRPRCHPPGRS